MFSCIVKSCQDPSGVLFPAPKDPAMLFQWKKVLKIQEARKSNFFVCEKHFSGQEILIRKTLKPDACPFPNSSKVLQCRSCMGVNLDDAHMVTKNIKDFYKDLMGIEITDGYLCASCFQTVSNFEQFQQATKKLHSQPEETTFTIQEVKSESEEFEQVIQVAEDEYYVVSNPKSNSAPFTSSHIKHTCQNCKMHFTDYEALDTHIQNFHSFACNQCNSKFANQTFLDSHKVVMHQARGWAVRSLGKETRDCVIKGIPMHFPTRRNLCDVCQTNFDTRSDVLEHMRKDHSFKCPKCPSILTTLEFLEKHQLFSHSGRKRRNIY